MDVFTPLVLGTAIVIAASVVTLLDKWQPRKEPNRKRRNSVSIILFLFATSGAILTCYSGKQSQRSANINKKTADSLQNELLNQVTGGNSKPHLIPKGLGSSSIGFDLISTGKYSIQDIVISFTDQVEMRKATGDTITDHHIVPNNILSYGLSITQNALNPGIAIPTFYKKDIPKSFQEINYNGYTFFKNGSYAWGFDFKRDANGNWKCVKSDYAEMKTGQTVIFDTTSVYR